LKLPAAPARAFVRALAVAVAAALLFVAPAWATEPERDNVDARPAGSSSPDAGVERARDRLRDRLGRFAAVSVDPRTDTLRSILRLDGLLTGPSGDDEAKIALSFVREHADAFGLDQNDVAGLRLTDRSVAGGVEYLSWEQRYRGIPAADAGLKAAVTGAGRLLSVTGPPAPDLEVRSVHPALGARAAYAAARQSVDRELDRRPIASATAGAERETVFDDGGRASLALYRSGTGYRLGWRVLAPVSSTAVYDMLVDAHTGAIVRRVNRVNFANAKVFAYTPATGGQVDRNFPATWLSSTTALSGPNVHAFADVHDIVPFRLGSNTYDLAPEPGSDVGPNTNGNYEYPLTTVANHSSDGCPGTPAVPPPPPTTACTWDPRPEDDDGNPVGANSWAVNREQSATQLFYLVNVFHDHLRTDPNIAFTSGGFERTDKPLGDPNGRADPTASDPVLAQTLDGADTGVGAEAGLPDQDHSNNSNFLALPDGYPGLLQMNLWEPPFGGYDGSNDASMVFHEYTHGLSNRLVTDAAGYGALNTAQAGALGEGLSDFYAMDYLEQQQLEVDDPDVADVRLGRYLDNGSGVLVRFQPIDCTVTSPAVECPAGTGAADPDTDPGGFTYADFAKIDEDGPEVHSDGEIWAQTLWSIRGAVGVAKARRYITEAMRLSPPEPSFLDMRNAILEASPGGLHDGTSDDAALWMVFAARGMGYFAGSDGSDDTAPIADFTDPRTLIQSGSISGTVSDEDGPLAGATVGVAGFDDGLGPQHVATSGVGGEYSINGVPTDGIHTYPAVRARKSGFKEDQRTNVPVPQTDVNFSLVRDWSSAAPETSPRTARVTSFTGPDNTDTGCGPGGLVDDLPGVVWGTSSSSTGQEIVVELGAPVDVRAIEIDPSTGCGDDTTAALGEYEVLAANSPGEAFRPLASNVFDSSELGQLNRVFTGDSLGVRYIKLRAKSSQGTTGSGASYIDVAELHVAKVPGSPVGAAADTGAAQGVGQTGATLTGSVVPHSGPVQVIFEYGTTTGYGSALSAGSTSGGETAVPVSAATAGLQPSTSYHFRVVALRGGRRYEGGDATFTTTAGPSTPPPPQPPPVQPPPVARITELLSTKLTANRKGFFKVKVEFGDAAPLGSARLTVLRKGKRLARATTPVRQGRTVTKTLRLSKKGRRTIKPGRTKKVTLELRLPDGQKIKKPTKLTRSRR
jgi:extracellular elastinolytic metalloproteinase